MVARVTGPTPAGGVLSGLFPNPTFAADMATQEELDDAVAGAAGVTSVNTRTGDVTGLSEATDLTTHTASGVHVAPQPPATHAHALGDLPGSLATDAEVASAVTAHTGAGDPHTGYRLESVPITAADVAADVATQAELDAEATTARAQEALKLAKASNLSDLASAPTALANIGGAASSHTHAASATTRVARRFLFR